MIGRGGEPGGLQRGHHRPIGIRGEIGRGGLHHDFAAGREMPRHQPIHGHGIELAQREVGGVGQVDDDDVELLLRLLQPFGRVVVHHAHFGAGERAGVEAA